MAVLRARKQRPSPADVSSRRPPEHVPFRTRPEAPCPPARSSSSKAPRRRSHRSFLSSRRLAIPSRRRLTRTRRSRRSSSTSSPSWMSGSPMRPPSRPRAQRNPRTERTPRRRPRRRPSPTRTGIDFAARSGPRRPWPPCPSCAWPTATTSRSGSASWRPERTTSSPDRSTHERSRRGSRRSSCASSDRSTRRRSSRPTASRSRRPAEWSPSSAPRVGSGRRPSRRTSRWRRRSDGPTALSSWTWTCNSVRSRPISTCPPSRP